MNPEDLIDGWIHNNIKSDEDFEDAANLVHDLVTHPLWRHLIMELTQGPGGQGGLQQRYFHEMVASIDEGNIHRAQKARVGMDLCARFVKVMLAEEGRLNQVLSRRGSNSRGTSKYQVGIRHGRNRNSVGEAARGPADLGEAEIDG
jgi:hypothetical protein